MTLMHARTRPITANEFNRMAEVGILGPDERVELIEGAIIPLSPQNPPHGNAIGWATNLLVERYGATHLVRVQLPLSLGDYSEPEPDFALVLKAEFGRAERHPTRADLIIEVASTSLDYDRFEKASLYARFGIPEYWVVNLESGVLETHRDPRVDPSALVGYSYGLRTGYSESDLVTPGVLPPATPIRVGDLLGRPL